MYFISKNFWFTIHVDSWFWRIIDRICWAFVIFRLIPNLQACTDRRMDSQMDGQTVSQTNTLAVRGLEEPCASFPDFCDNRQFHVIYCVSSCLCTLFQRISDSRFTWIHDFEEYLTKSIGPVLFSAQYLICRHVQTDGRTHRRTDSRTN